ncbi:MULTISPECIES: CCA tRNA nucleotidyltransferase [Candidatus Neomicrothrix]|uniref:Putative tRNA nucleotidyltransferase n=1 Tax=Candidatus Neomicrothrix parvicella RN1 TaxID=1229780 RepID=R4Z0X2_9ACTN|nr:MULTISPECIES: CCA tRNA nucleotidyltransferase [Microthrix]MBK6503973.1 CCA tRNA nucleotidyltransferase [Candidatus Microthrix sp.]MBP6134415.1 CCA tRNA nucleotidyltransferase [Candidatus Microthrix sp.]MBP6148984.1 CCA tRNA nucleotidyltransferase [Candidatus Microthrix sp.]MBP7404847.1 CCA tRNA nucleotidyltransferase [Candidatus Microthrix sp.]MBP7877959.1 CCA tRNA nucleotidyltransferase [Candidatus Microthrix sp.]
MIPPRLATLLDQLAPLAERFAGRGHRLYLVGGSVRDLLLGSDRLPDDLDFTTEASPEAIKAALDGWVDALWTQGERFGTIGAKVFGVTVEITTHRAEVYHPASRKPEVTFSTNIIDDLARRDFTVNAMALEVTGSAPELIDPFEGAADLAASRLVTPSGPHISFGEDPLRMMRAARFIASHGLVPDDDIVAACTEMAERLSIVSAERIRDELNKLIVVPDPSPGLWFLHDTNLADQFFPELPAMRVEQDPIHRHKDVLAHTIAVVAKTQPELIVRLGALFHDVGKPDTRSFDSGKVSFHHHEVVGARMTKRRMRELKYSNELVADVSRLVYLHLRFHTYQMGWTDSAVRRFVRDAGPLLDRLIDLTRSDCTTRNRRKAEQLSDRMDSLEERIAVLAAEEELAALRPDLDGKDVIRLLGIEPGPVVGRALAHLLELRLEHGPLEPERAEVELRAWWAGQNA